MSPKRREEIVKRKIQTRGKFCELGLLGREAQHIAEIEDDSFYPRQS